MKVILLACLLAASQLSHAIQSVDIGEYWLQGVLQNGSREKPGKLAGTNEKGYMGLLLDDPIEFSRIINKEDASQYAALKGGTLQHIQMIMSPDNERKYKKLYGKRVKVRCSVDFVGRYYTPVFCDAGSISEVR
ncbi:DUF4431 domain-containing protein [Chromobacterium haemolyticum]|uniref:DUF4431 domain-containing protein n=1 Tax=Chromobacterium haemolyticum TaxID=394935 RepID=UPI0005953609|nr:DUF4431 domain-containing protein [Chromobacterium haemolyticum]